LIEHGFTSAPTQYRLYSISADEMYSTIRRYDVEWAVYRFCLSLARIDPSTGKDMREKRL